MSEGEPDRDAMQRELEQLYERYPGARPKPSGPPEMIFPHHGKLNWHTPPAAGKPGGEVRYPPRSAPPMLGVRTLNCSDPRGFLEAPPPRRIVEDVTPPKATNALDARLRRENEELKSRLAALEAKLGVEPPVKPEPPADVRHVSAQQMLDADMMETNRMSRSGWQPLGGMARHMGVK